MIYSLEYHISGPDASNEAYKPPPRPTGIAVISYRKEIEQDGAAFAAPSCLQRVEKPRLNRIACAGAGEREGAAARLAWDRMPRNALPRKACGQRSEDFCAAVRRESNGILEGCRKSPWTFSTA